MLVRRVRHPVIADRDDAGGHEAARPHRRQGRRPGVGPDAVGLVITEVGGGDRVPGLLTDLKDPGHHLAPASQHLAVVIGEIGMLRSEELCHGAAVRQRLLQGEMVYHVGDVGLAGDRAAGVLLKRLVELLGKARCTSKLNQLALQPAAA
ncbi:MAG: hypothetical protein ACHP9Z_12325, partial [Streptosporangiales bacterium]